MHINLFMTGKFCGNSVVVGKRDEGILNFYAFFWGVVQILPHKYIYLFVTMQAELLCKG